MMGQVKTANILHLMAGTICVCWALLASAAQARDIPPMTAAVSFDGSRVQITFEGPFKPLIEGHDPRGLEHAFDHDDTQSIEDFSDDLKDYSSEFVLALMLGTRGHNLAPKVYVYPSDPANKPLNGTMQVTLDWPRNAEMLNLYWPSNYGHLVVRKMGAGPAWDRFLIGGDSVAIPIYDGRAASRLEVILNYITVGIDHIIPLGLAHILFALALFFYASRVSTILAQVIVFSVGHIVSIAVVHLSGLSLPIEMVELTLIALTIYFALENIATRSNSPLRMPLVFAIGVMHGMGVAGLLKAYGLAEQAFVASMFGFNIGFEIGQLVVLSGALLLVYGALQVDQRGENTRKGAAVAYGLAVLTCLFVGFIWWPELSRLQNLYGVVAFGGLLMCLSSVSIVNATGLYRPRVSVPASLTIAIIATYMLIYQFLH